ncbi:biotin transporter BioY [Gordonia jinhuaensis]|uniref:Biotin transporter n=1 Tax=Gordonia jinhuaensis TaxID=1517702 RepID=A0A916SX33_9ACTN|nr:biotin transporter BioY [Gordonia jinhuaensis]GGB20656.1 hypothetical protein GCM10011489_05970 [Gordonia jinhuaensis]
MVDEQVAAPARSRGATDIALIAGFAALIAACALMPAIHVGAGIVPITLQTFGVLLAGAVLGARRGFLAVLLYLAVGLAGLPVFSGGAAGPAVFAGPTAGYLIGFPFGAWLCGLIVERLPRHKAAGSVPLVFAAGFVASAVFIHLFGIVGLMLRVPTSFSAAFRIDWVFWPGDLIKIAVMALVATAVHRAFPDLLPQRRRARA